MYKSKLNKRVEYTYIIRKTCTIHPPVKFDSKQVLAMCFNNRLNEVALKCNTDELIVNEPCKCSTINSPSKQFYTQKRIN